MKLILFAALTLILFESCDPCKEYSSEAYLDESVTGITSSQFSKWVNETMEEWGEPSIVDANNEVYRLAIRSGFRQDTSYIFRVQHFDTEYVLTIKKLVATDSTGVRKIVDHLIRRISKDEWKIIRKSFTDRDFWKLPITIPIDVGVTDAHVWILEGYDPQAEKCNKRSYHSLARVDREESDISTIVSTIVKVGKIEIIKL